MPNAFSALAIDLPTKHILKWSILNIIFLQLQAMGITEYSRPCAQCTQQCVTTARTKYIWLQNKCNGVW
jgi:hypothetical protein